MRGVLCCSLFGVLLIAGAYAAAEPLVKPDVLPVDSDNDGVVDRHDACAFTAVGVQVDERGCPRVIEVQHQVTLNVNFDYDSAQVKSYYAPHLLDIIDFMTQHPLTRVIIEGHTDSDGPEAYNVQLSERRARAVAELLINTYGLSVNRVTPIGFGEARPLVANDSPANKRRNRRVVALIKAAAEDRL
ncbi:MAG: OmpA family protein [Cellvibrionaceae bacterium]|nr:OmpA family protein [Cellvibrionaceae bacterium]